MQKESTFKLIPVIYPEDASNKEVNYTSSDSNIVTVDTLGNITAVQEGKAKIKVTTVDGNKQKSVEVTVIRKIETSELFFTDKLNVNNNIITGLDYKNNTVKSLKENIITNYNIEIYNYKDDLLEENSLVGTGSKIKILDENNQLIIEYNIILYGDVNGDGKINSVDLLVLQRHILEIQKFDGLFLEAGNINKNGKKPSSVDLLLIQRHILELQIIEQ